MKIRRYEEGGVVVLLLHGKIDIGVGDIALRDSLQAELSLGTTKILLDLAEVVNVDASGVSELVLSYRSATERGAQLKLACLPPRVADILHITQLSAVLEIFDEVETAIASFREPPPGHAYPEETIP